MSRASTVSHAAASARPHTFDVEDVEYLRHGDVPLLMRLFRPHGDGPFPLVVDLHGGAWCNLDRTSDILFNETLARSGVMVAALDFRMPPRAGYPASLADINYAVRWLKARSAQLQVRPAKVGIIGISSGGHQAILGAMRPADPRYAAIPLAGGEGIGADVACAVLVWPVIDPLRRYQHALRLKAEGGTFPAQIDHVLPLHHTYWGSDEAMEEGNPVGILERGEPAVLPPVLYVQGAGDVVHPRADLERFVAAYRRRGGDIDLALYEGEAEGFIRNPSSKAAPDALARIVAFVHGHLGRQAG